MNSENCTTTRPATPEDVLGELVAQHRQTCEWGYADPVVTLTFATTIAEWREATDMIQSLELGQTVGGLWGIQCSDQEWRSVLEPEKRRTLGEFCRFIAARATMPVVGPLTILGRPCRPAAMFLAIRRCLEKAGADVTGLTPSTPLEEYVQEYYATFLCDIDRLAPGRLPLVKIQYKRRTSWRTAMWPVLLLPGLAVISFPETFTHLIGFGRALAILGGILLLGRLFGPPCSHRASFGDLQTFRDLAVALCAEGPDPHVSLRYPRKKQVRC
ncbi:MAG: hypothetical protein NTV86_11090 [Planctomycetota bacterium]|nr:hypothetical protein [Planctomycetota bacterium]